MLAACDAASEGFMVHLHFTPRRPHLISLEWRLTSEWLHSHRALLHLHTPVAVNFSHAHSCTSMVLKHLEVFVSLPVILSHMDSRNRDLTHQPYGHWATHSTSWASAGRAHTLERKTKTKRLEFSSTTGEAFHRPHGALLKKCRAHFEFNQGVTYPPCILPFTLNAVHLVQIKEMRNSMYPVSQKRGAQTLRSKWQWHVCLAFTIHSTAVQFGKVFSIKYFAH